MPPARHAVRSDAFLRKLQNYVRLSTEEREAVARLGEERVQRFRAHEDVVREGEAPRVVRVVLDGWACRYKHLEDGRRQVLGLFLPGDMCDLNVFILREMDHFVGALTPLVVAQVTREAFEEATLGHPRLLQALWWDSLVGAAIQREWLMNLGQRDARERIAHLMCEVYLRLRASGRARGPSCDWPLTQAVVADITGLSTVHVSRTYSEIRAEGLVAIEGHVLTIPDLGALMEACLFNPNYLHLGREGRHMDADD